MFAPMKKLNFYSGPAILPPSVLEQAKNSIEDFAGSGLSVLEISHRSKEFVQVMEQARALVKELMQLNNNYEVLFMHGGALSQFHIVPMNLLNENETASYFDTGTWANGALTEAKNFGKVHIACSSRNKDYTYLPKAYNVAEESKYLHITSNNTIYGTQINAAQLQKISTENKSIVCDMSSDIFSRQLDYNQYDLIYASAQKNIGPSGTTLVAVNKNILGTVNRSIPKMLDYRKHIEKESMLNTPSVFSVYVSYLMLQWMKAEGLENIEARNIRKAAKLYALLDASNIFEGTVAAEDRSLMNVCFKLKNHSTEMENAFVNFCTANNILGIKGHRSVGGFRASIYNAMPEEGVDTLIEVMKEFERTR
jgi:phosphoserine aminotransferase